MKKSTLQSPCITTNCEDDYARPRSAFDGIADKVGLSGRTVRNAFARKPITYRTARLLSRVLGIDTIHFRIKEDNRGRNKKPRTK